RIEDNVQWPNNHVFVIDGTVNVGNGDVQLMGEVPTSTAVLTIQAGTQVYAAAGTATSLVVTRGSALAANGTSDLPIIFASVEVDRDGDNAVSAVNGDPTDLTQRGEWGGVVLSGFGVENAADTNNELITEAAPTEQERWFGGNDNMDGSGSLRYIVIAESGFEFRTDGEVQGLTLEAAGSGTTLEFIQVIGSEDDCIEWFGGAASAKWLLCQGADDDGLDMDEGYVGNIQYAIVIIGAINGERGIESDNNSNFDREPFSAPNLANITILGDAGRADKTTTGALHREGFRGKVFRSVYSDNLTNGTTFEGGCLDIDNVLPAALQYRDVIFNCSPGALNDDDDA
ncbi:MAG: hypothetical protein AAFN74_23205, partial [Myxococcota bacterium]